MQVYFKLLSCTREWKGSQGESNKNKRFWTLWLLFSTNLLFLGTVIETLVINDYYLPFRFRGTSELFYKRSARKHRHCCFLQTLKTLQTHLLLYTPLMRNTETSSFQSWWRRRRQKQEWIKKKTITFFVVCLFQNNFLRLIFARGSRVVNNPCFLGGRNEDEGKCRDVDNLLKSKTSSSSNFLWRGYLKSVKSEHKNDCLRVWIGYTIFFCEHVFLWGCGGGFSGRWDLNVFSLATIQGFFVVVKKRLCEVNKKREKTL